MSNFITRFAPSPTGYLHKGHAASASLAFGWAQMRGGVCLLRIEDIDSQRCRPPFEQAIYEDLHWLGFRWPDPVLRQSEHLGDYRKTLRHLRDKGLVYRCFKTRKQVLEDIARAPHGAGSVYHGPRRPLGNEAEQSLITSGKTYAWRLSLKACREHLGSAYEGLVFTNNGRKTQANPDALGDVILARKDVGTSYHLACTHDDAKQNITDIIRGTDLLASTHIHRLLQEIMGWPVPNYHHHGLLTDRDGKRFAKRDQAQTLRALRQAGETPQNILASFAGLR